MAEAVAEAEARWRLAQRLGEHARRFQGHVVIPQSPRPRVPVAPGASRTLSAEPGGPGVQ